MAQFTRSAALSASSRAVSLNGLNRHSAAPVGLVAGEQPYLCGSGESTRGFAAGHLLERCQHSILIETVVPNVSFGIDPNL
jgi:hypothetical protein